MGPVIELTIDQELHPKPKPKWVPKLLMNERIELDVAQYSNFTIGRDVVISVHANNTIIGQSAALPQAMAVEKCILHLRAIEEALDGVKPALKKAISFCTICGHAFTGSKGYFHCLNCGNIA